MFAASADAKTSPGRPPVSWVTRSEDPAKLNATVVPGFCCWKMVPISVKVAFSEAAAETFSVAPSAGNAGAAELDADEELAAWELEAAEVAELDATEPAEVVEKRYWCRNCNRPRG